MTELIDVLRNEMTQRIDELTPLADELARLRAALDALDGIEERAAATVSGEASEALEGVRGVRQRQALEVVTTRPGLTTQDLADELGLDPGLVYAPVRRLIAAGHIVKRDFGLYPAE